MSFEFTESKIDCISSIRDVFLIFGCISSINWRVSANVLRSYRLFVDKYLHLCLFSLTLWIAFKTLSWPNICKQDNTMLECHRIKGFSLILFEMFDGASLYQAPIRVIIWTEKIASFVKFSCETAQTKSNSLIFVPSRTFSDRWCTPFLSVRLVTAVNEFKICE